jgi:hypothetical protein
LIFSPTSHELSADDLLGWEEMASEHGEIDLGAAAPLQREVAE